MGKILSKEKELLESKEVREQYLQKVDELEKIKKLVLLPNTELMTTRMVAEWYEVETATIEKLTQRNREELTTNGFKHLRYKEIKELVSNPDKMSELRISRQGSNVFSKRAVLNIGMLLRDSEVAKKLRSNILDVYEAAPDEIKTNSLEIEKELILDIVFGESQEDIMLALNGYKKFKDRHINQLETVIEKQKPKVKIHDQLVASINLVDMLVTAKNIGIGEKKLFEFLRATNIIFKQGSDNIPYQQYQNEGYFKVKTIVKTDKYNREYRYYTIKVTGKGKVFIANLVDKYGGAKVINSLKLKEINDHVNKINKQLKSE